jgi:thiol-disulfide isomerase/thioredoxin
MKISVKGLTAFLIALAIVTFSACSGKRSAEKQRILSAAIEAIDTATIGLELGNRAPELEFLSPQGKIIALSELRGKIVLIDFWASWCMPCRVENPNLVHVYNKFKKTKFTVGKGFAIYSVSLDTDRDSWTKGIEKDGLTWDAHVSDLKGWYSLPAAKYQVASIPANFLINGNGIIIAKNLRAEALESTIKALVN